MVTVPLGGLHGALPHWGVRCFRAFPDLPTGEGRGETPGFSDRFVF